MRIGVFVGSFNPVHKGHIKVADYLLENDYVDKVLLLATPNYWDKNDLTSIEDRVKMLKFFETDKIIVDDVHNKHPYTYEVLRSLKEDYPEDTFYLIMGADNIENFDKWKNVEEILQNKIIVLNRNNIDIYKYIDPTKKDKFIPIVNFPFIDVSSTEIRKGIYKNIDPRVVNYIKEHVLYKGE